MLKFVIMVSELHQLDEKLWVYPCDNKSDTPQPNVGILCTDTQTILIDAGNSPRQARHVMGNLASLGAPPVTYLIYTHHHWDHTFGGMGYSVPNVVAHEDCLTILKDYAQQQWNATTLREEVYENPLLDERNKRIQDAVDDWRGFRIVPPTIAFSTSFTIYLDGITLDLFHVGGEHASDSIVIAVQELDFVFIADCFYPMTSYAHEDEGSPLEFARFEALLDSGYERFLTGHDANVYGVKDLKKLMRAFQQREV